MKRLYVRPGFRGLGIGKALAEKLVEEATRKGFTAIVLVTLDHRKTAMTFYEFLGFFRTAPYYRNPLPGAVYWRLDLGGVIKKTTDLLP